MGISEVIDLDSCLVGVRSENLQGDIALTDSDGQTRLRVTPTAYKWEKQKDSYENTINNQSKASSNRHTTA